MLGIAGQYILGFTLGGLNDFINKVHGVIAQAPDNAASV